MSIKGNQERFCFMDDAKRLALKRIFHWPKKKRQKHCSKKFLEQISSRNFFQIYGLEGPLKTISSEDVSQIINFLYLA